MIFTQADRERAERIERALTSLHCDVGLRTADTRNLSLHQRFRDLEPLLNKLGAALGRIESRLSNSVTNELLVGLKQDIQRRYDDILKAQALTWGDTQAAVNRRADEALDVVRGLQAVVENINSSPLTPLGEALAALPGRLAAIEEKQEHHNSALQNMIQAQRALSDAIRLYQSTIATPIAQRKARRKKK